MSNVTTLINVGPDAFSNLYDVVFKFPSRIIDEDPSFIDNVSVRVQDFPFPDIALQPYTISYKAIDLKQFAPKIAGARKLTLSFRVDSKWNIYKAFKAWKRLYANENNADITFRNFMNEEPNGSVNEETYGYIEVRGYHSNNALSEITSPSNSSSNELETWRFYNVACINVDEPSFTREAANPIMLSVSFIFGVYVPPGETNPYTP
jgi:hypothetical protein